MERDLLMEREMLSSEIPVTMTATKTPAVTCWNVFVNIDSLFGWDSDGLKHCGSLGHRAKNNCAQRQVASGLAKSNSLNPITTKRFSVLVPTAAVRTWGSVGKPKTLSEMRIQRHRWLYCQVMTSGAFNLQIMAWNCLRSAMTENCDN